MPPAPYICIPGVPNFRDIGGHPLSAQPTKQVRRNTVFRSGRPTLVLDRGVKKLKMLAISHMFDLRSRQELTSARYDPAGMLWAGTERVGVPVFRPEEYCEGADGLVGRFERFGTSVEVSLAP